MTKNTLAFTFFTCISLIFSGCATVFVPSKQTLVVKTVSNDATVYINNEELGKGKIISGKIEKDGLKTVTIKTDGYRDKKDVLIPTHRCVGYWVSQFFNMPFNLLFFYPLYIDNAAVKTWAYDSPVNFDNQIELPKKSKDEKFIDISNIRININNSSKEISSLFGQYKTDINAVIKDMDDKKAKNDFKEEEKIKNKKNKKKALLNEEDENKIKYDDVIFTSDIYKTLKKAGYIDTVNTIFTDNNNTIVLEGKIGKINFYTFYVKKIGENFNKGKVNITWYFKNTYGEVLDSVVSDRITESYHYTSSMYKDGGVYYSTIIGNAVELSFLDLLKTTTYKKYNKTISDFNIKDLLLTLQAPKGIVTEKQNAAEASVIVKTKKGHGSGFAVTNDGYIVTNYHVISDKYENSVKDIKVITSDGLELKAVIVRYNKFRDLALLKVDRSFAKAFQINNTKSFKNLQDVYTIGAPKSIELGQSISLGLISNERSFNNNPLLQLNMSVNSGNSGGPLFDALGNLHGVIVAKLVGKNTEGVSFAIPGYLLQDYLKFKFN